MLHPVLRVLGISSAEKLSSELYVAFFKFKIHLNPDTGQTQIFGWNLFITGSVSCVSDCHVKANKQKKVHSCMRSLLSSSCFSLPSLSKHLSLIIALHKSFEQFILLTGGQSGRKLDIDTEEIAFLFSFVMLGNSSYIFENLSICPTLILSARNKLEGKSTYGLT